MIRRVLLLSGPPGVGKTTAARLIADRQARSAHIESDRFFSFIRGGYVEPWRPESHEQNVTVMAIVSSVACEYADAGYETVVDGIITPRWFLQPLSESLRDAGHRVAYAVLRAPLEVCLARAAGRAEDRFANRPVIERLCESFADLGPLERCAVEADGSGPEAVAEEVLRRLAAGELDL